MGGKVPGRPRARQGHGAAGHSGLRAGPPEAAAWSLAPSRSQPLFSVVPGHKPRGVAEPGLMTRLRRPRSGRTSSSPTEKAAPRARNSKQRPGRFSSRRRRQPHLPPAPRNPTQACACASAFPPRQGRRRCGRLWCRWRCGCVASGAGAATSICVPASATSSITASAPSAHMSPSAARRCPGVAAKRVLTTQVP